MTAHEPLARRALSQVMARAETSKTFAALVPRLLALGPVGLVGGALRAAYFEDADPPKDYDFVVWSRPDQLQAILAKVDAPQTKTAFGGCRLHLEDGMTVDVWALCDTRAFLEGRVEPTSFAKYPETVAIDWDCGILCLQGSLLSYLDEWVTKLESRIIDGMPRGRMSMPKLLAKVYELGIKYHANPSEALKAQARDYVETVWAARHYIEEAGRARRNGDSFDWKPFALFFEL